MIFGCKGGQVLSFLQSSELLKKLRSLGLLSLGKKEEIMRKISLLCMFSLIVQIQEASFWRSQILGWLCH